MKKYIPHIALFLLSMGAYVWWMQRQTTSENVTTPSAPVEITSKTPGAQAIIDGVGPYVLPYKGKLPIGNHEVVIDANGYESRNMKISATNSKETVSISLDLTPPSNVLSFFPLTTETGVIAATGNSANVFYAIRDQIQEIKTYEMKTRFPGIIQKALWSTSGYGLFLTTDGWYYFTPPVKHAKADLPGEPIYISDSGKQALVVNANKLQLYNLDSKTAVDAGEVPVGNQLIAGIPDPKGAFGILVMKQGASYVVARNNFTEKTVTSISGTITAQPSVSISADGSYVLYTTETEAKSFTIATNTAGPSYKINNSEGTAKIATMSKGFVIFEKDQLAETKEDVTATYSVFPPQPDKRFGLYDVVMINRIDLSFSPTHIKDYGVVVAENNGTLWYLGDPTNLPPSLFDRSLPSEIYRGH